MYHEIKARFVYAKNKQAPVAREVTSVYTWGYLSVMSRFVCAKKLK